MTAEQVEKTMALITPTTSYDGFDQVDIVTEAVFENMDLKKSTFAEIGKVTRPDCILASNSSTLDIDRVRGVERPPAAGARPPLLQPGERDEAARDRPRARDEQGGDRHLAQAREEARQSRRRRRQLLRVRRQPDARLLHARGLPAARGRRERRADRSRADRVRAAGRSVRDAGHRRHRRRRAHPAVPGVDRQVARRRAAVGDSGSPVRDGPLRAEDRRRLVQVRCARQPQPDAPIR